MRETASRCTLRAPAGDVQLSRSTRGRYACFLRWLVARREPDLDGWWVATHGELGGVRLPDEALTDLPLLLANGRFRLGSDEGRTVINRHVQPRSLDLIPTRGPHRGRIVPAIIHVKGSALRICCDLSGASRPVDFVAPPGTRRFLATYRRVTARTIGTW